MRKRPTGAQKTFLLQECEGACPFCGLELIGSLELHHIDGNSANTTNDNLIAVCGSCHEQLSKSLIPASEANWRKMALQHGTNPAKKTSSSVAVSAPNNSGVVAQSIGTVNVRQAKSSSPLILPGSIGSSPQHYNYTEYLIKKLAKFRQWKIGQSEPGDPNPAPTRRILANQLGGLVKDLPLDRFEEVVLHIHGKIANTTIGRIRRARGQKSFHSFAEH